MHYPLYTVLHSTTLPNVTEIQLALRTFHLRQRRRRASFYGREGPLLNNVLALGRREVPAAETTPQKGHPSSHRLRQTIQRDLFSMCFASELKRTTRHGQQKHLGNFYAQKMLYSVMREEAAQTSCSHFDSPPLSAPRCLRKKSWLMAIMEYEM